MSIDKVKEEKWISRLRLHRAYINWGHVDSWYWITWNNIQALFSWNTQGQIIFKDDVIENLNMIYLLS